VASSGRARACSGRNATLGLRLEIPIHDEVREEPLAFGKPDVNDDTGGEDEGRSKGDGLAGLRLGLGPVGVDLDGH